MKTLSLVSATVFCATLLPAPTRADDPPAIKLAPQIQAMLAELLKNAEGEPAADAAPANPPPAPPATATTPAATAPAAKAPGTAANQPVTSLQTGTLRTGSLMTSAPLGGHGLTGGTPRLTAEEWRQLFPGRK